MNSPARWGLIASLGIGVFIVNAPFSAGEDASRYAVTVPKEVSLEKVQMFYQVKRPVGRYVVPDSSTLKSEKVHGFVFPTEAGDSFEAVFYCPGYQYATVYDPAVTAGEHSVEIGFQPLPTLELKGKCPVRKAPEFAGLNYVVEIYYHGGVGITHLKMQGGHELPFRIAEVAISADGTFTARIPDFYHDPLSAKDEFRGLDFRVHSTRPSPQVGYVSYGLAPKGSDDFKIEADYHGLRDFIEHNGLPLDCRPDASVWPPQAH